MRDVKRNEISYVINSLISLAVKIDRRPDLFAVHPEHGTLRVDYCGALVISGTRPVAVEGSRIVFESGSAYRNKARQAWGVPIWDFAKRGAGQ